MSNDKKAPHVWIFFLPGVLFMFTACVALIKGRPINVVFFVLAIASFLLGLAMAKNARKKSSDTEPAE